MFRSAIALRAVVKGAPDVSQPITSSSVAKVKFRNVDTFKFMKYKPNEKHGFLVKPEICKESVLQKVKNDKPSIDDGAQLTLIPSPLGQDDPIDFVFNTYDYLFVITESGRLFAQGPGDFGLLGLGKDVGSPDKLTEVTGMPPLQQIVCGSHSTTALTKSGEVYAWGHQGLGPLGFVSQLSLGVGKSGTFYTPQKVAGFDADTVIVELAAGHKHVLARDNQGRVWTWGNGEFGRLGLGSSSTASKATLVDALLFTKVRSVQAGKSCSLAHTDDGVFAWGRNESGQLGTQSGSLSMDVHAMEALPCPLTFTDRNTGEPVTVDLIGMAGEVGVAYAKATHAIYRWGEKLAMVPQQFFAVGPLVKPTKLVVAAGSRNYFFTKDNELHFHNRLYSDPNQCQLEIPGKYHDIFNGYSLGVTATISPELAKSLPVHDTVQSVARPAIATHRDGVVKAISKWFS